MNPELIHIPDNWLTCTNCSGSASHRSFLASGLTISSPRPKPTASSVTSFSVGNWSKPPLLRNSPPALLPGDHRGPIRFA